ncbi:hypothetical protein CN221_37360 [Sinorhizobium meliloti]|uniref:hypothetical protein n=1 Tax=Rhizobium meliloti TaxID=382 RepID=UPI000FE09EB3|nr:hypothetical protein [Sinorhizobium meliloti]RVG80586.1 hypothetical protein CN221_37360 [Sinorhizobium meliloti]RVH53380.1 hypothetical protein CN209_36690 [Sinorhizobium meliloti]
MGKRLVDLDDKSLVEAAKRLIPDGPEAVNMLLRHRGASSSVDRRSRFIFSPEDDALIRGAENAAKRRGMTSNVGNRSSLLRQLADGLRHQRLTLGALDDAALQYWAAQLMPGNSRIGAALRQLEEYRAEERAKNNRQAGEGSSHQAAPFPMEVDQAGQAPADSFSAEELWAGAEQAGQLPADRFGSFDPENYQAGQAPADSFSAEELWAGAEQAGQLPADRFGSFDPENGSPSPAQSVNQSSPPMSDQGYGAWLFGAGAGAVDFGQHLPPNWDDGIQADMNMLRRLHYNNVLPDEHRQMTTITVSGQLCTAVYNGRINQVSDVRIYRRR